MNDQSRDTIVRELMERLASYRKQIDAIRDPGQITGLHNAQEIARRLQAELSEPSLRDIVPVEQLESLRRRTSQVLTLQQSIRPYEAQRAITDLRTEISTLMNNLDGDPTSKPKRPWEDPKESQKTKEERKRREEEEKQRNKENKKPKR